MQIDALQSKRVYYVCMNKKYCIAHINIQNLKLLNKQHLKLKYLYISDKRIISKIAILVKKKQKYCY